jgi:hypothetical protein
MNLSPTPLRRKEGQLNLSKERKIKDFNPLPVAARGLERSSTTPVELTLI